MSDTSGVSLVIGGEVKTVGLAVAGSLFVFSPLQMQFLINLQKLKNVAAASLSVDKPEDWGKAFLSSKKFRHYLSCKMQEYSVKNGLTVEWWYQFGKWSAEGHRGYWDVRCAFCEYAGRMNGYEVESYRNDDMTLVVPCPGCYKPMACEEKEEPFLPNREQLVAWQELGARLIPKIERVHHQFENTEIIFENAEGGT